MGVYVCVGAGGISVCFCVCLRVYVYVVTSVGRIDKIIVSFAKEPYKRDDILQETYDLIDTTDRSHPISDLAKRARHHRCQIAEFSDVVVWMCTR